MFAFYHIVVLYPNVCTLSNITLATILSNLSDNLFFIKIYVIIRWKNIKEAEQNTMSKKKCIKFILKLTAITFILAAAYTTNAAHAYAKGNYTVKTSTKPCNKAYTKASTYTAKTRQYYMLRSYLEKLEKEGGGTLTLKKGTYKIPCTLYVPSNVTIKLKNDVILKKTAKTGTKKLSPTNSMFELVPPSKAGKVSKVKKYAGSKNITITASGTASINMASVSSSTGIVIGHSKKVTVSGITFKNMYGGSFINISASKSVSVTGCTFTGYKKLKGNDNKYAIRLEIPDSKTKAFPYTWSNPDKTANQKIKITNNTFTGLYSAIGSFKYTENIYHNDVRISGNTFTQLSSHAIRILNWNTPAITGNTFSNINNGTGSFSGIYGSGVTNPVISSNTFDYVARPIYFDSVTNSGAGKKYAATKNIIGSESISSMYTNTVTNAIDYYVANGTDRLLYFTDTTTKDYVITAGCEPYRGYYTDNERYNHFTKDYYVFKSYLEQLERVGGGTLTVQAGTYSITNTLYVPSNTTIYFKNGVTINKGTYTGFSEAVFAPSLSIFQFVTPAYSTIAGAVGGYNGGHDIKLSGEGNVNIDLLFYNTAKAIVMCHNTNVVIENINFHNYMGHHFIELDASKNVTIQNCTFTGSRFTGSSDDYKEAINIDTPDKNTGGFNQIWTNYDRTPNDTIIIQNNAFTDTLRAIGTHSYSVSPLDGFTQLYHTNIQVLNNIITNTTSYAIRTINWKDCIIKGNTIRNVNSGNTAAILMSGTVNPTITENIIDTADRPITLNSTDNTTSSLPDKVYPPTHTILDSEDITGKNISDMLNNILIDMKSANAIRFFVGGKNKASSTKTLIYQFDEDHIKNTTVTPPPTQTPEPSPEPSATQEPVTVQEPVAAQKPVVAKEPVAAQEPSAAKESVTTQEPSATKESVTTREPSATKESVTTPEPSAAQEPSNIPAVVQ